MMQVMQAMQVRWIVALLLTLVMVGCASEGRIVAPTAGVPTVQRLRVGNLSDHPIEGLIVLFPGGAGDALAARVEFGDVPPGELSDYVEVPGGVYSYAAYSYILDGARMDQAAGDWIGEVPMEGRSFTYEVSLDTRLPSGGQIRLVEVTVDEE